MSTKEQERKALEQIRKIVAGLGENSYVATAFEGCFEIAATNIEHDAACSMKERKEAAEAAEDLLRAKAAELSKLVEAQKKARDLAEQAMRAESERANNLLEKLREMKALADDQERAKVEVIGERNALRDMLEDKDEEIIRLKAKLYDLMAK